MRTGLGRLLRVTAEELRPVRPYNCCPLLAQQVAHSCISPEPPLPSSKPVRTQRINLCSSDYMKLQRHIDEESRAILIDRLVSVHSQLKLLAETLHLTVNIIDRFLEKEPKATCRQLDLIGVTAMFIASKYEEQVAPDSDWFGHYGHCSREQILAMEGEMLSKLNYQLAAPNALVFLKRFSVANAVLATPRTKAKLLAQYLIELALQDYTMLQHLPSTTAAAAAYLALKAIGGREMRTATVELLQQAGSTEDEIMPCVKKLHAIHGNAEANELQAVRKKFARKLFGSVTRMRPATL